MYQHGTIELNDEIGQIGRGVQQGSILAPALFNIYVQEILDHVNKLKDVHAQGYADDNAVLPNNENAQLAWDTYRKDAH